MPTYDYECDACGHHLELFQRITEDPLKKCPECKKNRLRRLFGTGAAIVFKGSGFYETDYRSESYKKEAKKAEEGQTAASPESSSDSSQKTSAESGAKKTSGKTPGTTPGKTDSAGTAAVPKKKPEKS
jgi:putative FmdB family regulatory protein